MCMPVPMMVVMTMLHPLREPFNGRDDGASGAEDTGVKNAAGPMAAAANVVLVNTLPTPLVQSPFEGSDAPPPMLNLA